MKDLPLVTVFIPYYNDEKYLSQSIESVLNQTYTNTELILLNHASEDNSRDIAHSYTDERIVHIDMDRNYGAGGGILFEKIVEKAQGKYLKTLCADDMLKSDCLEIMVEYIENNPEKDFIFSDMNYVNSDNKILKRDWASEHPEYSCENTEIDILKHYFQGTSFLPFPAALIKQSVLQNIKFEKTYIMIFDMWLWTKLLINGCKIGFIDKKLVNYRIHENQVSTAKKRIRILYLSYYESAQYCNTMMEIKDFELLKAICSDCDYLKKITKDDTKYFPFIVALEYLKHKFQPHKKMAYSNIQNMLNDENFAQELKEKFSFTVKEFRELYTEMPEENDLSPKDLGLSTLIFLFCRQIWKTITFQKYWNTKYTI